MAVPGHPFSHSLLLKHSDSAHCSWHSKSEGDTWWLFHVNLDNWVTSLSLNFLSIKHERYHLLCRLSFLMTNEIRKQFLAYIGMFYIVDYSNSVPFHMRVFFFSVKPAYLQRAIIMLFSARSPSKHFSLTKRLNFHSLKLTKMEKYSSYKCYSSTEHRTGSPLITTEPVVLSFAFQDSTFASVKWV